MKKNDAYSLALMLAVLLIFLTPPGPIEKDPPMAAGQLSMLPIPIVIPGPLPDPPVDGDGGNDPTIIVHYCLLDDEQDWRYVIGGVGDGFWMSVDD
jgi:hypothetical protein